MNRETLEKIIADDTEGLLEIKTKAHWRIYGSINGKRGGTFQGISEDGTPIFGGSNLIYAPVWWDRTWEEVAEVCKRIMADYPNCEASPLKIN